MWRHGENLEHRCTRNMEPNTSLRHAEPASVGLGSVRDSETNEREAVDV